MESINVTQKLVAYFFGFGLFINAGLFVTQAWKILKTKNSEGVSLVTFSGFCVLQLSGIFHGFFQNDPYLMWGMIASFLACGSVTVLAFIYQKR